MMVEDLEPHLGLARSSLQDMTVAAAAFEAAIARLQGVLGAYASTEGEDECRRRAFIEGVQETTRGAHPDALRLSEQMLLDEIAIGEAAARRRAEGSLPAQDDDPRRGPVRPIPSLSTLLSIQIAGLEGELAAQGGVWAATREELRALEETLVAHTAAAAARLAALQHDKDVAAKEADEARQTAQKETVRLQAALQSSRKGEEEAQEEIVRQSDVIRILEEEGGRVAAAHAEAVGVYEAALSLWRDRSDMCGEDVLGWEVLYAVRGERDRLEGELAVGEQALAERGVEVGYLREAVGRLEGEVESERAARVALEASSLAELAALEKEVSHAQESRVEAMARVAELDARLRDLEAHLESTMDAFASEQMASERTAFASKEAQKALHEGDLMSFEHERSKEYFEKKALLGEIEALSRLVEAVRRGGENQCMDYELQMSRLIEAAEAAFDDFEEQINQYNELSAAAAAASEEFVVNPRASFVSGPDVDPDASLGEEEDGSGSESVGSDMRGMESSKEDMLRQLRDKLHQVETYECAVLGDEEAAERIKYRIRGFIDELNGLLEKDVALALHSRQASLAPFSRKSQSSLQGVVHSMIRRGKCSDASTQTAADRILQRVMQLEPTTAEAMKLEEKGRKDLLEMKMLVRSQSKLEDEEKRRKEQDHAHAHVHAAVHEDGHEGHEGHEGDVDPAEADDTLRKLTVFGKHMADSRRGDNRPGPTVDWREVQALFQPFLAFNADRRAVPGHGQGGEDGDTSARAVTRKTWEKRWRRGRVLKNYGGPLMKRVPPFVRYIRRHEETLAQRVGQLSVMLREAKALHERLERAIELVDLQGGMMFDDSDDESDDDEVGLGGESYWGGRERREILLTVPLCTVFLFHHALAFLF